MTKVSSLQVCTVHSNGEFVGIRIKHGKRATFIPDPNIVSPFTSPEIPKMHTAVTYGKYVDVDVLLGNVDTIDQITLGELEWED